jgi:exosortase
MVYDPLKYLLLFSNNRDYYSHIIIIPIVSYFLIYLKRKTIFMDHSYSVQKGIPLILLGIIVYLLGKNLEIRLNDNDYASLVTSSAVVFINGAFILFYGTQAFKAAIFPFLLLIFMIPVPSPILDGIIYFLQVGSTEFTNVLFMATGVPFLREGFVFHLPGQSVEVAKQCSGIRSSMALLITSVLAGHLFLRTWWKKVILAIVIIPITMFKNGIRVVSLTLLGTYVDSRILTNSLLHTDGGILFFLLALVLLAPVLYFLRKSEVRVAKDKDNILDSCFR